MKIQKARTKLFMRELRSRARCSRFINSGFSKELPIERAAVAEAGIAPGLATAATTIEGTHAQGTDYDIQPESQRQSIPSSGIYVPEPVPTPLTLDRPGQTRLSLTPGAAIRATMKPGV